MFRLSWLVSFSCAVYACSVAVQAATFVFGNNNPSGLNGLASGTVANSEIAVSFAAGPGTAIIATDAQRLGVDSRSNPGVVDPYPTRLNLLEGTAADQGEFLRFSFDRPGILDKLYFDGMKDETLEYFILRLPNGTELALFDFEAEYRLNFQNFVVADIGVPNFTLAGDASDDFSNLGIRFAAGEEFTLTYGQIDYINLLPGYVPMNSQGVPTGDLPNGARFEGLSVVVLPEPTTASLLLATTIFNALTCTRRRGRVA
jgi:hypothetical protein